MTSKTLAIIGVAILCVASWAIGYRANVLDVESSRVRCELEGEE